MAILYRYVDIYCRLAIFLRGLRGGARVRLASERGERRKERRGSIVIRWLAGWPAGWKEMPMVLSGK